VRLDHLWIGNYKNLKDVTIDFDENHWITVLIGWNGTGKSNVLEALATLFRDLVMGENADGGRKRPTFAYKLKYTCRKHVIHIDADPARAKDAYRIRVRRQHIASIQKRKAVLESSHEPGGTQVSIA
jgi:recombinational DNA repair ATPase RecF